MDTKKRLKLKKFINELASIRGRHTELVSVYIPAGYELIKVIQHLKQEQGTAVNIKDAKTRKNVIDSLEKLIRHLQLYKKTPPNGLAAFAGNTASQQGKVALQVWSIEPPEPIKTRIYRCDQTFLTEILRGMLEEKGQYALIVMDRREATLGVLRGTSIKVLAHLTSGVPGKIKAGGQCLSPNTLIMKDDGDIIEIEKAHNPLVIQSENFNQEISEETPIIAKWENKKSLYRISTCYPKIEIEASKDHTFFVRSGEGIKEKKLSEIREQDYLVMPEKITLNLKDQQINFKPELKRKFKKVEMPKKVTPSFAKILGYYLGDGSHEIDRLTFFEQRKEVATCYKNLLEKIFRIKTDLRFRKSKNYYQIRIYSRVISQLFNEIVDKKSIPSIILKSSAKSLAGFISGFFDAEGYVSSSRVALSINDKKITKQLQLALLRLNILSSLLTYDNKRNPYSDNPRYTIEIADLKSINIFKSKINFTSIEKQQKLDSLIKNRSNRSKVRQLVVNGKTIARILKNSNYNLRQFQCPSFFVNKRQMSKGVFKQRILDKLQNKELRKRLKWFYNSNLIAVKISKIKKLNKQKTIDIETKNHNFIANGLIVHNSAQRYHRITEGLAKEFYKRISEAANKEYLGDKELKGLIIGGPGPTKEQFKELLNEELKKRIIAIQDITYTDEYGLHALVEKSQDVLAKETIIEEKKILKRFFTTLAKEPEKITYGKEEVKEALKIGAVEVLLLSEEVDDKVLEELEILAEKTSSETKIISTDTNEGMQLKDLGGIAAILRYAMHT